MPSYSISAGEELGRKRYLPLNSGVLFAADCVVGCVVVGAADANVANRPRKTAVVKILRVIHGLLLKLLDSRERFFDVRARVERAKTDVSLAGRTESAAGGAHDVRLVQKL